jgi:hypothetical protein
MVNRIELRLTPENPKKKKFNEHEIQIFHFSEVKCCFKNLVDRFLARRQNILLNIIFNI